MAAFDPTELTNLIDEATHELLLGPDWTKTMIIVDLVRGGGEPATHACKRIIKKLGSKKTQSQILALNLLEAIVKNTDGRVHVIVQGNDVMKAIVNALGKKGKRGGFLRLEPAKVDRHLQEVILTLVRQWGEAFAGQRSQLPGFSDTYMQLVKDGWEFPQLQAGDKIVVLPSDRAIRNPVTSANSESRHNSNSVSNMYSGSNENNDGGSLHISIRGQGAVTDETAAVREQCTLLRELVSANSNPSALKDDEMIKEVLHSLRSMQQELASTAETSTDENILMTALSLHDDIDKALDTYTKAASGKPFNSAIEESQASLVNFEPKPAPSRDDPNRYIEDLMGGTSVMNNRNSGGMVPVGIAASIPVLPPPQGPSSSHASAKVPILPPPPGSRNPFVESVNRPIVPTGQSSSTANGRSPSSSVSAANDVDTLFANLNMSTPTPAPATIKQQQVAPVSDSSIATDDFDSFFSARSAAISGVSPPSKPAVNSKRDALDDIFS